ncbi:unnamed protein product [Cuscuta epithymum]|uniref:Alpha/beta hydrolase fold-3 domain-containing protein n=1 Tax=Cuscuta epithymum TaxID=186058 RepID=A0AAV0EXT4_9ASTE|nr:unnamed protein product [Cuscuta epithymum]
MDARSSMSKFDPYEHLKVSLNDDGSLTRFVHLPSTPATGECPPSVVKGQTAVSKDVILDEKKNTWIRIFLPTRIPSNDKAIAKLPIIFYFRPGGWILFSVADTMIHESCNLLCSETPAIVVAVEYRLAPESRLPAQYEDAVEAVMWVREQATAARGDSWLRNFGDISRCYLYGVSSGANVAYNAALLAAEREIGPLNVAGVILNQPLFGGKKRTESEMKLAADEYLPLPVMDMQWEMALPKGADRDHRFCNPMAAGEGAEKRAMKKLGRVLVIGFGGDPLIDRQQEFVQMLVMRGVSVDARFDDAGFHGIDMVDSRTAAAILTFIKDFV